MKFKELDISELTKKALKEQNYTNLTEIQEKSLDITLKGKDLIGCARTGSGKTLCFIIPVLERLLLEKFNKEDGLGALIISPTRDLAIQTYNELRKIGKYHSFSLALLTGGKEFKFEQERIKKINIIVSTPGRLLQHLDSGLECCNLRVLCLDECDMILDLGFKKEVDAILEHFKFCEYQSLLFSATLNENVLKFSKGKGKSKGESAEIIRLSEQSNIQYFYLSLPLNQKINALFTFIKSNLSKKTIIFVSSCKQVRYLYSCLCKLQPGTSILNIHGKMKLHQRIEMVTKFKISGIMIATDVASRGLDIPKVDWVVHFDCPADLDTFVHRSGRTARYKSEGKTLLFVSKHEESILGKLNVDVKKMGSKPFVDVQGKLMGILSEFSEIKYLAEKAFVCYVRSVWKGRVFDLASLDGEGLAWSMGLSSMPKVKFLQKEKIKQESKEVGKEEKEEGESGSEDGEDEIKETPKKKTKLDRLFNRKSLVFDHSEKLKEYKDDDNDEEFLVIARKNHSLSSENQNEQPSAEPLIEAPIEHKSVRDLRKQKLKAKTLLSGETNTKLVFDDDGNAEPAFKLETEKDFNKGDLFMRSMKFVEASRKVMEEADRGDKILEKEKRREKKAERKRKERAKSGEEGDVGVVLGRDEDSDVEEESYEVETSKKRKLEDDEELALRLLNGP